MVEGIVPKNVRDLTGQKSGRLTVTRFVECKKKKAYWECVCECGKVKIVSGSNLMHGKTSSCGCYKRELQQVNIIGKKFGYLIVEEWVGSDKFQNSTYLCRCLFNGPGCLGHKEISGANLRSGATRSCGCYRTYTSTTHGLSNTPEYRSWQAMIQRCTNELTTGYKDYGGRGIKVCGEWMESFECFLGDLGKKPSGSHSLDRVNPDGDYEPKNCRWATPHEQNQNQRKTIFQSLKREKVDLRTISEVMGCSLEVAISWKMNGTIINRLLDEIKRLKQRCEDDNRQS